MERLPAFFWVPREYQQTLRDLGLTDTAQIFSDPRIVPWRSIPERENCILDTTLPDGRPIRLHVKRYRPTRHAKPPGEQEADGILALELAKIPTAPIVAWGKLADGRSFLITEDLTGYRPADKAIQSGLTFQRLLAPTAELAAKLHAAGLHHRDLYLCHFLVKLIDDNVDLKLIDAARVRHLPAWFFRNRWIIKDLAQFWYSAQQLGIPQPQLNQWLQHYARQRQIPTIDPLRRAIERKVASIARHDARLNAKQPNRNISLPET